MVGIMSSGNSSIPLESDAFPYTVNLDVSGLDAFSDVSRRDFLMFGEKI